MGEKGTRMRLVHMVATAALALALVGVAACGGGDKKASNGGDAASGSPSATAQGQTFDMTPETGAASPTPEAVEETGPRFPSPSEDAQLVRLMIPTAKVNAPLQIKGVNARNEMENPDGKDNVAWYNFTAKPGFGSNAVFSGHVDWFTGEQGVFWYLRDLKGGEEIALKLSDGTELKYRVVQTDLYDSATAPVAEIVGPTPKDMVTLITCEGTFSRTVQEYDKRRVVRAERIA